MAKTRGKKRASKTKRKSTKSKSRKSSKARKASPVAVRRTGGGGGGGNMMFWGALLVVLIVIGVFALQKGGYTPWGPTGTMPGPTPPPDIGGGMMSGLTQAEIGGISVGALVGAGILGYIIYSLFFARRGAPGTSSEENKKNLDEYYASTAPTDDADVEAEK